MTNLDAKTVELRKRALEWMRAGRAETYRCSKCRSERATRAKDGSWFWCGVCGWAGDPASPGNLAGDTVSAGLNAVLALPTKAVAGADPTDARRAPRVDVSTQWRAATARRTSPGGPQSLVLIERFPTTDPADGEFRVWGEGLLDDEAWTLVDDVEWRNGLFTLHFAPGDYSGMPVRRELRRPLRPSLGSALQLLREDGKPYAAYEVIDVQTLTDQQRRTFERRFGASGRAAPVERVAEREPICFGEPEDHDLKDPTCKACPVKAGCASTPAVSRKIYGVDSGGRFGQAKVKQQGARAVKAKVGPKPAKRAPRPGKSGKAARRGRADAGDRAVLYTTSLLRSLPRPSAGDVKRMARRLWKEARADNFEALASFLNPLNIEGARLVPDWDDDRPEESARESLQATIGAIEFALETSVIWLPFQIYDEQKAEAKYLVCIRSGEFAGGRIFVDELPSLNLFELAGHGSIDLTIFRIDGPRLTKSEIARLKAEVRADFLADLDTDEVTFRFANPEPVFIEAEVRVHHSKTKTRSNKRARPRQPRPEQAASAPPSARKLEAPGGRWTVVRFSNGAPEELSAVVIETLMEARSKRKAGDKWVAMVGEFFMNEGATIFLFSPKIPGELVRGMEEFFEMFGPAEVRKAERSSLAFRGRALVWLQDDFERAYSAPSAKT